MRGNSGAKFRKIARVRFQEAARLDPPNRDAWWGLTLLNSSLTLLSRPKELPKETLDQRIATFKKMLLLDARNELAMANLGLLYRGLERYDEAVSHLERIIALPPSQQILPIRIEAGELLGRLYAELDDPKKAEEALLASIRGFEQIQKQSGGSYYKGCPYQALGGLYRDMGRHEQASRYLLKGHAIDLKSFAIDGKSKVSALGLASLQFERGNYDLAALHVGAILSPGQRAQFSVNTRARAMVLKGVLSILRGSYGQARQLFTRAETASPSEEGVMVGRAHLELKERRYQAATRMFNKAIASLSRGSKEEEDLDVRIGNYRLAIHHLALLGMAWASANRNEHTRALEYYDQILKRHGAHLMALQGKGVSSTALHRTEQAERIFRKILSIDSSNQYAAAELGIVKLNSGDLKGAEELFQRARTHGHSEYTCPFEGLGLVYLRRGDYKKAKKNFKKAISLNPNIEYKKYNGLARIYIKEGKLDEAMRLLRKSMENHPYDDEARKLIRQIKSEVDSSPKTPASARTGH